MFVYQHDTTDLASRLHRDEIPHYVQQELVPAMMEAFRVQTEDWGFLWQPAWTSYRAEDGNRRLFPKELFPTPLPEPDLASTRNTHPATRSTHHATHSDIATNLHLWYTGTVARTTTL